MLFSRDIGEELDFSKYGQLAIQCNTLLHSARFADGDTNDIIVDQAGDGHVVSSGNSKHRYIILHDWRDNYMPYVERSVRVVCLGNFDHPVFKWKTITLDSYPIPDYYPVPRNKDTVLVAGDADETYLDNIVKALMVCRDETKCCNVIIAIRNDGFAPTVVADSVENVCKDLHLTCTKFSTVSKPMIDLYYRSASAIVHCGSCSRGQLHSIAMQSFNRGAALYYGCDGSSAKYNFTPAKIDTLATALL